MSGIDEWEIVGRLVLAAVLGGLLGVERTIDGKEAGLRTHLLLALGAAVFGLISVGAWERFEAERAETNIQVDVTRVASYVAAGMGFLCGGVIVKYRAHVRGLTTAASLWVTGSIGLAAGVGFPLAALSATVIALAALALMRPLQGFVERRMSRGSVEVRLGEDLPVGSPQVRRLVESLGSDKVTVRAAHAEDGRLVIDLQVADPARFAESMSDPSPDADR